MSGKENTETSPERSTMEINIFREINCDQVHWILSIFDRYLPTDDHPRVSQEREMKKYAMLYELMDVAKLCFTDDSARWNGTPNQARPYEKEVK